MFVSVSSHVQPILGAASKIEARYTTKLNCSGGVS